MQGITDISVNDCSCVLSDDYLSNNQYVKMCNLTDLYCYVENYFAEPAEPCQPACKHTAFEILSATQTKYPADLLKGQEQRVIYTC